MAVSEERNRVARELDDLINLIIQDIFEKWSLNFQDIKDSGSEPLFDREIISRIYKDDEAKAKFLEYKKYASENYGKIWDEFSEEQQDIIALKESKIFW